MSYMKLRVPANLVSFLTFSFKYIYGELVELYLLSRLSTVIDESSVGLYSSLQNSPWHSVTAEAFGKGNLYFL